MFLRALNAMIAAGRAHLAAMDGTCPGEPQRWGWRWRDWGESGSYQPQGDLIGWADGDDAYLDPDVTYRAARQWAEQAGTPLGMSRAQLHDDMKEKNVLASTDPGRTTVRRDISGVRSKRVLHLTARTFENHGQ